MSCISPGSKRVFAQMRFYKGLGLIRVWNAKFPTELTKLYPNYILYYI